MSDKIIERIDLEPIDWIDDLTDVGCPMYLVSRSIPQYDPLRGINAEQAAKLTGEFEHVAECCDPVASYTSPAREYRIILPK